MYRSECRSNTGYNSDSFMLASSNKRSQLNLIQLMVGKVTFTVTSSKLLLTGLASVNSS